MRAPLAGSQDLSYSILVQQSAKSDKFGGIAQTGIRNRHSEEPFNDRAHNADRMSTDLFHTRILDEELTTGESRSFSNCRVVILNVSNDNIPNKFVEDIACQLISNVIYCVPGSDKPEKSKLPNVCKARVISASFCSFCCGSFASLVRLLTTLWDGLPNGENGRPDKIWLS